MGKYICSSKQACKYSETSPSSLFVATTTSVPLTEGTSTTKQSEILIAVCRSILHVGATD